MNTLKTFVVGPLEENCYVLFNEKTLEAAIIDPGAEPKRILSFIKKHSLNLKQIILTHGHGDHIGAVSGIQKQTGAYLSIHAQDAQALGSPEINLSYSLENPVTAPQPDRLLNDNDELTIGTAVYKVIYTPGHTAGGICLFGEGRLFSGDTLFLEGIGRSDLPGGNGELLIRMIKEKLFILPEETNVYSGHGPETTIGWEKEHNPFD